MPESGPLVVHSQTLDFNADSAEFCPVPGLTHLLALGTYQLLEERQERVGRCYLSALKREGAGGAPSGSACVSSLDMPGIFDLKWRPTATKAQKAVLGAALADGTLRLLEVVLDPNGVSDSSRPELQQQGQVAACSSGMCLSLDWQVGDGNNTARIATSSSAGTLSIIQATDSGLTLLSEWEAHSLETWCTAFHKAELNTGGGNWRLRWHPQDRDLLLAACMYNGFGVLRASDNFRQLDLVCMYDSPNQQVAYGADWWQEPWTGGTGGDSEGSSSPAEHKALAATCSFYNQLHTLVWLDTRA